MTKKYYIGADLERWRIENGLETTEATHAFGLQYAAWLRITKAKRTEPLEEGLALLLHLYRTYPEVAPMPMKLDIEELLHKFGFSRNSAELKEFGRLLGRTYSTVQRVLNQNSRLGKVPERLLEAYLRLDTGKNDIRKTMEKIAADVKEGTLE